MAKKNTPAVVAQSEVNRSEVIRKYKADHPNAGPSEIAKALAGEGLDVSSSLVSSVLNTGRRNGRSSGLSVETIKLAAEFVKAHKGKLEDAEASIKSVGTFIDSCGGADSALAALQSYRAVAEVIG